MDPFQRDGGFYPPHQPYGYPAAPPPVVNNYYNYTMPPDYGNAMHPSYGNAMHPSYGNAMPPTPPGYPYNPTPAIYPAHQSWQNYWQPPQVYPGTPHEFDAYGNQAAWPDQTIEPDQGWTDENVHSAKEHREFDVVEVKRNVLPPPPKGLPAKPQHLTADTHGADSISLENADVVRTALSSTTAAPLRVKVNNNQTAAAPDGLARVPESTSSSMTTGGTTAQPGVRPSKTTSIRKFTPERLSPTSTPTKHVHVAKPSPTSTPTKHVHVAKPRDANPAFHADTEERPNLAPFEIDQEYTGDTFRLLTATMKPPPGWVLIGPDCRRSKPPIEVSTQVIVAIIHCDILKHWSGFKITIFESSITGHYFDSLSSDREGRAHNAKSNYEVQLQRWFQQVGKKNQAKIDLIIIDSLNQTDGTSCGPYVWHFVECAFRDEEGTMKPISPVELRKQHKALVLSTLQILDDVKTPKISKSDNAFKKSELDPRGLVTPVRPSHKQQEATMIVDLEWMESSPMMPKSEKAPKISELDPHSMISPVESHKQQKGLAIPTLTVTKQSQIPVSWHTRSNDQQSRPVKRPTSGSFGPVAIFKKPKPTKGKSKTSRAGHPWTAEEYRIAVEIKENGGSWEYIARILDRTAGGVEKRITGTFNIWVPSTMDLKLLWTLVHEKKKALKLVRNTFKQADHQCINPILKKIRNGWPLTYIPTEPDHFLTRIRDVPRGEKFDHKDRRGVVYPRNSLEPFEYRWIDDELVIIDTVNLLINVKPLLVWYPFISKSTDIRPICYAVVEKKTSKWFAGEWVSILSGIRLYLLSGHWNDELQDLVLFDNDGKRRQTHKDMVRPFKDDNGEIMCSLCDLGFSSHDSYLIHTGLHEHGYLHIRHCCLDFITGNQFRRVSEHHCIPHQGPEVGPVQAISNRHLHGTILDLLEFNDSLSHDHGIDHNWDLIAYSVRWSSSHETQKRDQFSADFKELMEAYEKSYKPTSKKVIKSPAMKRSSRTPIFAHPKQAAKVPALNVFFGKLAIMEPSSRILIMSQSIEGLTTNLQSLACFARSMQHLRVTLGFSLLYPARLVDLGQQIKEGRAWIFYDLQKLRRNINGTDTDPRYMRLITALFVIQKFKQENHAAANVRLVKFGGGHGRNHDIITRFGAVDDDGQDSDRSSVGDFVSDDGSDVDEEYDATSLEL